MNGPLKTFGGLNKYQMFCTVCAGLLIFVCYRTAQPYPEFQVPTMQLVQKQTLHPSNVSMEKFLQVGPHWADNSRDTFQVHPDYVQKFDERIAGTIKLIPPIPDKNGEDGNLSEKIAQGGDTRIPDTTTTAFIDLLSQLEEVSRVKVTRPVLPDPGQSDSSESPLIILSPTTTPIPGITKSEVEKVVIVVTPVTGDPYSLPFRLEGIVKAKEQAPAQVILHDLESGKRIHRFQGQRYEGVIIRKIGPGTVEVDIPSESLQLRYTDTGHRWVTM